MEYRDQVYTVSQLNQYLKALIDSDEFLGQLTVRGELSNFTHHLKSGHFYFSIKDERASIKGVMFRTYAQRVRFRPESGMNVVLTGSVRVFERDGALQFYCERMEPDGVGALALAFEQLKQRLAAEGLFAAEHKKALPAFPQRIGVVTSKTGAALQDILNILSRRYPLATVVLIPVLVQGELAAASICEGLAAAEHCGLDVLILGRGGGSAEDLWCFNEESVARAVYRCPVPVVSAVGHEIDFTITDFVADLRAPTPSAAAELCTPDLQDLRYQLAVLRDTLGVRMEQRLQGARGKLELAGKRLAAHSPQRRMAACGERLDNLAGRLRRAEEALLKDRKQRLLRCMAAMEALSPMQVLLRGYSITYHREKVLAGIAPVQPGDCLTTVLSDGKLVSRVETILPGQEEGNQDGETGKKGTDI